MGRGYTVPAFFMPMKSQVCYNPVHLIDLKAKTYTDPIHDLRWIDGFTGIHLWVWPQVLFQHYEFNPVALDMYLDILKHCDRQGLEVTAKVPLWPRPWWHSKADGIPYPSDPQFLNEALIRAKWIVRCMDEFQTIERWTIGNEPAIDGALPGEKPGLSNPNHTPEDLVTICTQLIKFVYDRKPVGVELLSPALSQLGLSRFGLLETGDFLELLWPRIKRYCAGVSINAYPPMIDGTRRFGVEYLQAYRELMNRFPGVEFHPDEQGIRGHWCADETEEMRRIRELARVSFKTFGRFSYFNLYTDIEDFGLVGSTGPHQKRITALYTVIGDK